MVGIELARWTRSEGYKEDPSRAWSGTHPPPVLASPVLASNATYLGRPPHLSHYSGNKRKADRDKAKAPLANATNDESGLETPEPEATPAIKKARGRRGKPKGAQKFTERDESCLLDVVDDIHPIKGDMWERVAVRYSKWAEEGSRKPRNGKYLNKQIEQDLEAEVGMITVNDGDSDASSDKESLDDEKGRDFDSEPEVPAKPAKQTWRTIVERLCTP
ncbi:hypothetical protein FN846DRAFT_914151 [Sphaerosporella brunnea]|uniref:Uncharacterized protein n=1 Tax=Sphaerosporella brunnea TaxID=1250544 RepID=A0A5J5EDL0_9PEZI|nr:hypothetical protein FN846DRAFT_914151 [Sphaerosporella brunnea]